MSDEYEFDRTMTCDEAAMVLRDVADGVAVNMLLLGTGEDAVAINLPSNLEMEIELEAGEGTMGVELELEWPISDGEEDIDPLAELDAFPIEVEGSVIESTESAESMAHFEVYRDKGDQWRWRLVHRNGNVIADGGEGYTRKENALKGLRSVRRNAPNAEIVEETGR